MTSIRTTRALGALTLVLLAAGSGCAKKRPAGTGPYADLVAEAIPKIEAQLGLTFITPPKLAQRSNAEVAQFLMRQITSPRATKAIEGQQAAYRVLGLIPDTLQLAGLLQRLLEEQVIGYYDPATKVLYVVEKAPEAMIQQTVTHELVHGLQDQYVNLDSIQKQEDDADRQEAVQAVLEGQAVFTQLLADPNTGPMLKMPGGWDRIRDLIREGQTGMPVFASAPRIVREGLLFPYLGGADFVRRFAEHRPVKELLRDLPVSSKQLLNDAAYFTADRAGRDIPIPVTFPAPSAGSILYSNTLGEFETRLVLVQHLKDEAAARRAAGGLDGDRLAVVRTPAGDAVVWGSVWDTAIDAADFLDAVMDALRKRYDLGKGAVEPGATMRRLDVPAAKGRAARTVTAVLSQRQGRPLIVVSDVPAGVSPAVIDPAKVTLGR